jgi:hypothetical protein
MLATSLTRALGFHSAVSHNRIFSTSHNNASSQELIPSLPVLNELTTALKNSENPPDFSKTIFVCGQHLLNTSLSLFKFLLDFNAIPKNIFVVGKSYSNNIGVMNQLRTMGIQLQDNSKQRGLGGFASAYNRDVYAMWYKCLPQIRPDNKIIVLDDGGHVLENTLPDIQKVCKNIIGIEQTSSGVKTLRAQEYPTIELATSAIKSWVEPPMVAEKIASQVAQKLNEFRILHSDYFKNNQFPVCGIIGLGNIGKEVFKMLHLNGYQSFILLDRKQTNTDWAESYSQSHNLYSQTAENFSELLQADIIIGCTGYDVTSGNINTFKLINAPKLLFSCSSKDIEFSSLLTHIYTSQKNSDVDPLADINFQNGYKAPLRIIRGGFPVNFDNSPESVPANDIQITRGLKAIAVVQAYHMQNLSHIPFSNYMLSPEGQAFIAKNWFKIQPSKRFDSSFIQKCTDIEAIAKHSGGTRLTNRISALSEKEVSGVPRCKF